METSVERRHTFAGDARECVGHRLSHHILGLLCSVSGTVSLSNYAAFLRDAVRRERSARLRLLSPPLQLQRISRVARCAMAPITQKHFRGMNRAASGIKGVLETLGNQVAKLEDEIKADEAGKMEFERLLAQLDERKREVEHRIDINQEWVKTFDMDVGPFEQMYQAKTQEIAGIYDDAKTRHKSGIKVLIDEFSYHPEFFRPKDTFRAIPFVPK